MQTATKPMTDYQQADSTDDAMLDAEDAQWVATTAKYADKLDAWRARVRDEETLEPMFDAQGRWTLDDAPGDGQ